MSRKLEIHQEIVKKLDHFYETQKIPHIIFHGEPGSGKRTLLHEFLYKIYGGEKQKLKSNVMTVNCAHGKGIKFIREDVKFFAKTNIQSNHGVNFKSIVLLNADSLTIDAQSALRRCIELFSYNTRFFIVVENKHKLLNPILSRFCEIYVPEYIPEGYSVVNLHKYHLDNVYDFSEVAHPSQGWFAEEMARLITTVEPTALEFSNLTIELYERGFTVPHILDWANDQADFFTDEQINTTMMCYQKIKSEFRCEKLLMLYILDFLFFRSKGPLENIVFI